MKNLTVELNDVFSAKSKDQKLSLAEALINNSHAKNETKKLALLRIKTMSPAKIDFFMTNYVLSGEGMKTS
jgi:hypothetical protein